MLTFVSHCACQALQCAIPCTPYNNLSIDSFITTLQIRKLKLTVPLLLLYISSSQN